METIKLMEPEALEKFIPKIGDRLAILDYCSRELGSRNKRKGSLLEKLRSKLKNKKEDICPESVNKSRGKICPATKSTRMIDIGWLNFENGRLIQVRVKQGGGTRKISIRKDARRKDILTTGRQLFFVDGMSQKGAESEFDFTLCDFQFKEIASESTVSEMYTDTGFTNLRFYVTTYRKKKEATVVSNSSTSFQEPVDDVTRNTFFVEESEKEPPETITTEVSRTLASPTEFRLDQSFYTLSDSENDNGADTDHNLHEVLQFIDLPIEDTPTVNFDTNFDTVTTNEVPENIFNISQDSSPAHIILHRGNLLEELIVQFIPLQVESKLQLEIYLPNGELEKAADIGGVFRDVLSEFWDEFMNKLTVGTHARIPILRHDYDGRKWTAVAKILAKGLLEENYLPVQLSKSFIECCIYGENKSNIVEDFLKYVSTMDSEILAGAMQNFHEVDYSELLECLDNLDCKWQPKHDNIVKLIKDLAHKEIIQKPMFIMSHWHSVLRNIIPFQQLDGIYENQKNLAKNVLKILDFGENMKEDEKKIAGYLKKFIREGDDKLLSNFLRFTTGANIIIGKRIGISFVQTISSFSRTPVAHTCGCSLILPSNYESYPDFRNEFQCILNSNVWVMDIV